MHTSVQIMIVAMIWFKELEICILHGIQLKLVCYGVNSGLSDHHHVLSVASRSLPRVVVWLDTSSSLLYQRGEAS